MDKVCAVYYKPQVKPPLYNDDVFPAHRKKADPFSFRIGDVQLFIPPEKITVDTRANVSRIHALRQKGSIKTKSGYRTTEVVIRIWFNDTEQINGVPVRAPDGGEYYIDGLRALIGQFRRMPFLPVVNEHLNYTHNIWNLTYNSCAVSTVPEFPGCLQAQIRFFVFNHTPYTQMPDWALDEMFCWPLFRWHYQQQLRHDGKSGTYLAPLPGSYMDGKFQFKMVKEDKLADHEEFGGSTDDLLQDLDAITFPGDLVITGMTFNMQNLVNNIQLELMPGPTHQYLGSMDTEIMIEMETTNAEDVEVLRAMMDKSEMMAREYRNRLVSGYIKFENELAQLFGVKFVLITAMRSETVEDFPGTFRIVMSMISYDPEQKNQERVNGFKPVAGNKSDLITTKAGDNNFIIQEVRSEQLVNMLELYPDLELPTYNDVNVFLPYLNNFRQRNNLGPIGISKLEQPEDALYVDPDFFVFYPPQQAMGAIGDPESIDLKSFGAKLTTEKPVSPVADYRYMKLLTNSGLTAAKIDSYISRQCVWSEGKNGPSKMRGMGSVFLRAEQSSGINACFLVALAAFESGWGTAAIGNNLFGYQAYNSNPQAALQNSLSTVEDSIMLAAQRIRNEFVDQGCPTPFDFQYGIHKPYAQQNNGRPTENWLPGIADIMSGLMSFAGLSGVIETSVPTRNKQADLRQTISLEGADRKITVPFGPDSRPPQPQGEELYRAMAHDMKVYSKRGTLLRAFPTYVFLFVDEGEWADGRRVWNNYYAYHSISEIAVHKTRKQPAHTAYITMTNVYGNLLAKNKVVRSQGGFFSRMWEILYPTINDKIIAEKNKLVEHMSIYTGCRVHLRMGYGSCAAMLPVAFNGIITEISVGDTFTAICQGDGIELAQPILAFDEKEQNTIFNMGNEPRNILTNLLEERSGLFVGPFAEHNKYGIEHFGFAKKQFANGLLSGPVGFVAALIGENVNGDDLSKNVYLANDKDGNRKDWFGKVADGEKNLQMWLHGKCFWDIAQLLAQASPEYIAAVHDHGFHSTFFYGMPHWWVRYQYLKVNKDKPDTDPTAYQEAIKPFQQIHVFDSISDIVHNGIKATAENLVTGCVAMYTLNNKMESAPPVYADVSIRPELHRTAVIDTTTVQNHDLIPTYFLEKLFGKITGYEPGKDIAVRIAVSNVQNSFRDMYDGPITVLGDPAIKPYDLISIADAYVGMFGSCEAKEVVHNLSLETGFVTSVTPDLIVAQSDVAARNKLAMNVAVNLTTSAMINMVRSSLAYASLTKLGLAAAKTKQAAIMAGNIAGAVGMAGVKTGINSAIKGAIAANVLLPQGWISLAVVVAAWAILDTFIDNVIDFFRYQNVIKIYPLIYKDAPFTAGINGSQQLVPGGKVLEDQIATGSAQGSGSMLYSVPVDINTKDARLDRAITSTYREYNPNLWSTGYHTGLDFGVIEGTPVRAIFEGRAKMVIRETEAGKGYGNYILIDHGNGYESLYAHLASMTITQGARVKAGDQIGTVGSTGFSTGPHLHFEMRQYGVDIDPMPFIEGRQSVKPQETPTALPNSPINQE